ncbi:MAG: tetratricopeptide repeat protein [Steroidobacteraceae bacterium]
MDLLRPVAERAGASGAARRVYLDALLGFGQEYRESAQDQKALGITPEALRIAKGLGAPHSADATVNAGYAHAQSGLAMELAGLGRNEEARPAAEEALAVADRVLAQHPQYGYALLAKYLADRALARAARNELDPSEAQGFAMQGAQAMLALVAIEPGNALYANELGVTYVEIGTSTWDAGRLGESIAYGRKAMQTFGRGAAGLSFGVANLFTQMSDMASYQAHLGDFSGAAATVAATNAFVSPTALRKLGAASRGVAFINDTQAITAATIAYERGDFAAARRIARAAIAALPAAHGPLPNGWLRQLSGLEGAAEYQLGDFAAAAQALRTALQATETLTHSVADQRTQGQIVVRLSMALAREGKRAEAFRTIGPVVTMYRALEKQNRSDQWLPLEYAEALYAQALSDPPHRAALLREAAQRIDHLIPSVARLHDTRAWRARIEAAQRAGRLRPGAFAPG